MTTPDSPLKALAEPRRQQILRLIWDQERCAGDISRAMSVSFSAVSQHLRRLRSVGLVHLRRAGRQRFYRAHKAAMGPLAAYLESLWSEGLQNLKHLAEEKERGQ